MNAFLVGIKTLEAIQIFFSVALLVVLGPPILILMLTYLGIVTKEQGVHLSYQAGRILRHVLLFR